MVIDFDNLEGKFIQPIILNPHFEAIIMNHLNQKSECAAKFYIF